jgi:hypothetical protein
MRKKAIGRRLTQMNADQIKKQAHVFQIGVDRRLSAANTFQGLFSKLLAG